MFLLVLLPGVGIDRYRSIQEAFSRNVEISGGKCECESDQVISSSTILCYNHDWDYVPIATVTL